MRPEDKPRIISTHTHGKDMPGFAVYYCTRRRRCLSTENTCLCTELWHIPYKSKASLSSLKLDYYYIYLWLAVGFALVLIDKIINILKNICCICGITLPDYAQLDAYQSEKEADA